jgi:hypothetical protein
MIWIALTTVFAVWAYWPRLMDRIHDHRLPQEIPDVLNHPPDHDELACPDT